MSTSKTNHDFEIIAADFGLQEKIGKGPLNPEVVKKCQQVIEDNEIDFTPMATEILEDLNKSYEALLSAPKDDHYIITQDIRARIMQLKGNAAIFHYPLISTLSTIVLKFLEDLEGHNYDKEVQEIIKAHNTITAKIIAEKLKADTNSYAQMLEKELTEACERYKKAHNID